MSTFADGEIGRAEFRLISEIANRAVALFRSVGTPRAKLDCMMDIEAVHVSVGLKLVELRDADDANFAHDVCGIARHLDRDTGELGGCFLPRFARPEDDDYERCSNPGGHEWNRSLGEADEARLSGDYVNDNIRCIHCGADGDA